MPNQVELVRNVLLRFTTDFIDHPYLCYTEHGLHALFYTALFNALPIEQRFVSWNNDKVCVVQKEYPTAGLLGKPQRQHWDIAVIKSPPSTTVRNLPTYDYLRLAAVVEFAMNESMDHLKDDVDRVCHSEANVDQAFIVHLYRLSTPGAQTSGRDWSPNSTRIVTKEQIVPMTLQKPVEVIYGLYDSTGRMKTGLWLIKQGQIQVLR